MRKALWLAFFDLKSKRGVSGQDLVEYALLTGFMAVTVAAVVPYQVTGPIFSIFSKLNISFSELLAR